MDGTTAAKRRQRSVKEQNCLMKSNNLKEYICVVVNQCIIKLPDMAAFTFLNES